MKKQVTNWGNYPVIESDVKSFVFEEQLDKLIRSQGPMIPRGSGRCYGDSALALNIISTIKYDKILSFNTDNGIIDTETGITLEALLKVIVPKGWFLPVTPGTKLITLGGAVASDVHGKNHVKDGSFSKHIVDMDVLLPSGEMLTCSPTKNTDLFEATCGGLGLTGVITSVKIQLKKIETSFIKQKQIKARNFNELMDLFEHYKDSAYLVAWIDCLKKGGSFGRGILTVGDHALISDLPPGQQKYPLQPPTGKQISFPVYLPSWALNTLVVKAFNFLFFGKNFKKEAVRTVSYDNFFYPLDAILNWNRIYGKKGFVQYQFVMPLEAREGMIEIMNRISKKGLGSFLTVLKALGEERNLISFPRPGYTLALDFPITKGIFEFLDELDQVLLKYGGRIYLTKDARMKPAVLKAYSKLDQFKAVIKKYNPEGKFSSLQSDRLHLTNPN